MSFDGASELPPWSRLKTVAGNAEGRLVARKHFIWFFILLITAGSVAHPHCLV